MSSVIAFDWIRSRFASVDAAAILRTEEARLQRLFAVFRSSLVRRCRESLPAR